ncbi:hypothetical protein [Streptomyces sp. NBC_00162]|uniref:hypothetical protein n=1 Tax=Streptomyces sp. NBC_00162 TaxID=2903629 RepID=UPI00214CD523|nr:hypothetical protein [Streptomyces sp. NBC_00162]UUU38003.1 hypothetical protein JIW86_03485 [Streptomyces sp. NBC_00162]
MRFENIPNELVEGGVASDEFGSGRKGCGLEYRSVWGNSFRDGDDIGDLIAQLLVFV